MKKFRAEMASTNETVDGFTMDDLKFMEKIINEYSYQFCILIDFNPCISPIGNITSSWIKGDKLLIDGMIKTESMENGVNYYIVPGGYINKSEIHRYHLTQLSLTKSPTDKSLLPLEIIED